MPPKAKFSKEEIVEAALNITRVHGIDAVSAREVAAVLNSSARPIFTYFESMEDLKYEVKRRARELHDDYIKRGLLNEIPFMGVGQEYLRFANEEPELYKLLYLTRIEGKEEWGAFTALEHTYKLVSESVKNFYNMTDEEAKNFYRDVWLIGHSLSTLIVTGACEYMALEMSDILTEVSFSICKAYKEVPGLSTGECDKHKAFYELLKQQ